MKKTQLLLVLLSTVAFTTYAQIDARLMQDPDVSATHITFTYGNDIWVADKSGGLAMRLSSPAGVERFPRFSPDGKSIAYTANYNGNNDVYVIEAMGGIPKRLTYHSMNDRVLGWTPDGSAVLFASSRESGRQRYSQFYTVSVNGGPATKLPVPYGEYASFSPDGKKIAYTDRSRVQRNWKRYRGGTAPDIHVFDLETMQTENITQNDANDELPMWIGNAIYYMSDNGPNKRNNLWKYDFASGSNSQLTNSAEYDITYPGGGPADIVYEQGGKLFLYNIASGSASEVKIKVVSDQLALMPKKTKVADYLHSATISPEGNRVVAEARGELFNLPAKEGFVTNMTGTSGVAERSPAWSPDGKSLAYWSDASGEYQLMIKNMEGSGSARKLTNFTSGFYYTIYWSPDSKKIVFTNQKFEITMVDVASGTVKVVDKATNPFEWALRGFRVDWSPDSRYFAYAKAIRGRVSSAVMLYDTQDNKLSQLTSGFYSDNSPAFSHDGKHLFFLTNRTFSPVYSDVDNTFVYPNTTNIAVATLHKGTASLLEVKNDAVEVEEEKKEEPESKKKGKKNKGENEEAAAPPIDVAGFEERVEILDIDAGNINELTGVDGKLLFMRNPNSGAGGGSASLDYYDIKEREVKTIMSGASGYEVNAAGDKLLVMQGSKLGVISISADQKIEEAVPTSDMVMDLVPKEEWQQIFSDAWRLSRDYFYDPGMHGVDWNLMKTRYGSLVDQASSREMVNLIIGDLIAELNASHTYNGGGDGESTDRMNVGYLGADFRVENGQYRIARIIEGAAWDAEVRSPLQKPGIDVKVGEYILAVNNQPVDTSEPIYAAFQGLAGKPVELTVNSSASMSGSRKVIVKCLRSETRLRHLAWIENNRKRVNEATDGRVGYIYVRSTGIDGQNELVRQFYGQMDKEGLIIDERFNSGGQIPDRFIELLDRDPLAFWATRDGEDWSWPPAGNFGAKVMLINGFSGSGGDAFPDYFRKRDLGPLIGTRTWGGLIGISGAPNLIDNGYVTVPTFRMYDPDGEWFKEGHGVDPDIKVVEDFEQLAKGRDVQLERGIEEVMKIMNSPEQFKKPARPAVEDRK